jgi:hypothetical protein
MALSPNIRSALVAAGWIWPAYIQNRHVHSIAQNLLAAATDAERHSVLETALPTIYPPEDIAVMLLERYRKMPLIVEFQASISEGIEAAYLGLFHAAVSTLFPVIEGVIRLSAASGGRSVGLGTNKLPDEVDAMITFERAAGFGAADERITMLEIFRDFLRSKLLANTSTLPGARDLNRHGVLHGVFKDFGHEANFYILISILDLLTFIQVFHTTGISALAPDRTNQSRVLALYYRTLQKASFAGPKVGARL